MIADEILKTGLVFMHYFASAAALMTIVRTDFFILSHYTNALTPESCGRIHASKTVVGIALVILWLTGAAICVQGYLQNPDYILNQKLWMKVAVVVTLTINGFFLHRFAFRCVQPGARLCDILPRARAALTLMATISSGSWIFASFLGIARTLNDKQNFTNLAVVYVLLVTAIVVGGLITVSSSTTNKGIQ